ncbi:RHS repeat-associated core domain-containing protein, partial [Compostibacter hankyongensis]|uniref:RHS repeat domain-containing protein n=1 Tax=Compostibacter hankyongensis TaxID=1007089 RepID=UPI0031E949CA
DVRMVLTEQTDLSQYMATMEPANTAKENALFYNVDQTRTAKPQGYPEDETTTPNTAVALLNAREPDRRIGPSIILKVMAGDTLQAAVRDYYHQQGTAPDQPSIPAEEMVSSLLAALPGLAGPADPGHQASAFIAGEGQGPRFTANDLQQLKQKDPQVLNNQKPRSFLNYVFFDNQLNFVEESSGVKQVQAEPDELETLSSGEVVAKKSGYVYVYTSNESQQDVLFDNLVVTQSTGPVLEETHYYPFGQTMAGISTLAPLRLENRFKYNGKELNHLEFSDGVGLDIYDYGFRNYDPQIGRFIEQDPITDNLATLSPYQYAANDPIANIDVDGLVPFGIPCPGTSSMAIFFEKVGAGISQFANSPLARALSISIHTLQDAGMVQNAISTSNMINNAFTAVGVGIASSPIFDRSGNLLGTDDQGLQGDAIIMDKANFKQNMSHEDAMRENLGQTALDGKIARSNFLNSYYNLPNRPDYDGVMSYNDLLKWGRKNGDVPVFLDASGIDFGNLYISDFSGIGSGKRINTTLIHNTPLNTYGPWGKNYMTLISADGRVRLSNDRFDYDQHDLKKAWHEGLGTWTYEFFIRHPFIKTLRDIHGINSQYGFDMIPYGYGHLKKEPTFLMKIINFIGEGSSAIKN